MIKLVAALFALYAAYLLSVTFGQPHWFGILLGASSLAAATGLWFRKSWSQYLVYAVSFVVAGQWIWAAASYCSRTGWPAERISGHIFALIPGLCIVALAMGSSVLAFRCFRVRS